MKKLFRKNEVVRFKNEDQKKQLLDIAVKYGIKWKGGKEPFELIYIIGDCINFREGDFLRYGCNKSYEESNYKVISTKKFLKRFEEKQVSGWFKGNREEDKRLYYINRDENTFFGIDGNNDKWIVRNDASDVINVVKATNEEALQMLIEEAKKRGLVNDAKIKCLINNKEYISNSGCYILVDIKGLILDQTVIMHNGIWAEVVEETKPKFKPVFMKCTQEQFEGMKPKLEACGYVEEVYEPKVGDFGLFWDYDFDINEQNIMGYIKEVRINNSFKTICNDIYDNFTPLPKETEDIYNRIKNK